jgi:hypothetical protein
MVEWARGYRVFVKRNCIFLQRTKFAGYDDFTAHLASESELRPVLLRINGKTAAPRTFERSLSGKQNLAVSSAFFMFDQRSAQRSIGAACVVSILVEVKRLPCAMCGPLERGPNLIFRCPRSRA